MSRAARLFFAACLLALAGCSTPLPRDKHDYTGLWEAYEIRLLITPEGRCEYERRGPSGTTSVSAFIQRFEGDDFVVGMGIISTTFHVTSPPRLVDGKWKMTVDGVVLTRRLWPGGATS